MNDIALLFLQVFISKCTKSADLEIALFNLFILYGFIQNCKYEQSSLTQMLPLNVMINVMIIGESAVTAIFRWRVRLA